MFAFFPPTDYLMHRECFRYVEKEWDSCTEKFVGILREEMIRGHKQDKVNINVQYMNFCWWVLFDSESNILIKRGFVKRRVWNGGLFVFISSLIRICFSMYFGIFPIMFFITHNIYLTRRTKVSFIRLILRYINKETSVFDCCL